MRTIHWLILFYSTIYLTDEVAKAVKQELQAFIWRCGAQNSPKGKGYLFKCLVVDEVPA